ncbi:hypothetical protein SJAG_06382 [Schizosaccharomyces japonicus yFS275]|uniref:Uncharacterized protein n=1 Tax=Schizosaccharomyces japonicus (strain yFS275 / FY16936) TaxID=402676 RepID=T0T6H0_SCHJY|nr:hypothetical protein SJAG_06382 [Schizosaccharomyces japonicus yFS275]EQC53029.1 hypothetical protein SJAG_06382 [Schizosaccharomyces japonicus yFS275]
MGRTPLIRFCRHFIRSSPERFVHPASKVPLPPSFSASARSQASKPASVTRDFFFSREELPMRFRYRMLSVSEMDAIDSAGASTLDH